MGGTAIRNPARPVVKVGTRTARQEAIRLVEVFSSIQGEGILVGQRQVFVRTYGCNLRCAYCDSPETLKESGTPPFCRIETEPGTWQFHRVPNPIAAAELTETVRDYLREPHHSLSVTGGEPLLHAAFLERWLPDVRALGLKVFIETNGLLPDHLRRLLPMIDIISMDFKAPSATGEAAERTWEQHRAFLDVARAVCVYGKLVITPATTDAELDRVVALIAEVDRAIPLILQPVTPFGHEPRPVAPARMIALHARASRTLSEVRVIPQTHKMMQLL